MAHRSLTQSEIRQLERQGCSAEDWYRVLVADPFRADRVVGVQFSGNVRLGQLEGTAPLVGDSIRPCVIRHAHLHDCAIGDHCLIAGVGLLANYHLGSSVLVEQVGTLRVTGETSFGNGVEIDVLNEAGGRALPLCDQLSAQLAYLIVFYRDRPELVARLIGLVQAYAASRKATTGRIGDGASITNAGVIQNVDIGPYSRIDGAARLEEGTIRSCREAPARVGAGVQANHFIFLSGCRVDQGAIVDRCLVGQAVRLGKQYSAENSVFFCNSELFHGEGCSIFAGPYTVSHHKSTLLIAGFFSFYNAGSGTNQSNHMYKLGPVHQGVLERGSKTGSFSYLFWPSRVGAFSSVLGKHSAHFDTSDLPFSTITEQDGRSVCMPGMNLFTVGTRRDGAKWPARDGRTDPDRLDQVHFQVLSPLVIGHMLRGLRQLEALAEKRREGLDFVNFNGIVVKKVMIRQAARYYELAIRLFTGACLLKRLEALGEIRSLAELRAGLARDVAGELHPWRDLAGLLVPDPALEAFLSEVLAGGVPDLASFQHRCRQLHGDYDRLEWAWCARLIESRTGQELATIEPAALIAIIEQWRESVIKYNNMVVQDAAREFDADMQYGYGIDGDGAASAADFAAVRGTHADNGFVRSVREDSEQATRRAECSSALLSALA